MELRAPARWEVNRDRSIELMTIQPKQQLIYTVDEAAPITISADCHISVPRGCPIRFNLSSGGHWYGHGFAHRQPYPLNTEPIVNPQFAVNNIQSPIWMASAGFALLADTTLALDIRLNEADSDWLEVRCPEGEMAVQVFCGQDLPRAHGKLMRFLHWPPPAPEKELLGDSIFCTWTQYPRSITQDRVISMARAIREKEFPCSVITIDDRWESVFGELRFSRDFPHPKAMVEELHALGFRVLLWVTPFVNCEAASFPFLAEKGWLTPRKDGTGPSLFKWWGGTAGIIDITNPEARNWYRTQLLRLKDEVGVDGFKIDGGDAKYQPAPDQTAWHQNAGASGYVDLLLDLFEELAGGFCESRTAWLSQRRNILWRQGGKDSHWGVDNGLQAMVHLGQHLALLGYDLFIPDMVPGRIQTMVSDLPLPSDELFIRWTEASALMPIMQFSYFPWNYSENTALIAQRYALFHKALEDYLHKHSTHRAAPLLRPLWYDHPKQANLYPIGDEFLLGPDLLAAPVLTAGQIARDIILPPGKWRDLWTGEIYEQEKLIQHPAPCPGIPLFVRAEATELFETLSHLLQKIPQGSIPTGTSGTSTHYSCGLDRDLNVTG